MSNEKGLDSLLVWQRSLAFAKLIHNKVLPLFPNEEKWAMTHQLRRSSQSIAANIAEGYGRYYYQEGVRFCYIARGSLEESYSHLVLANEINYLPDELLEILKNEINELHRMLNGYITFLKRSKRGANEAGAPKSFKEEERSYNIDPRNGMPDP